MHKLKPETYARIRPLFEDLRYNLVVDSIIDGNTPAWVYVDNVDTPLVAWMWDLQDAMLVAGSPEHSPTRRALAELIAEKVIPDAQARHIPALSLYYDAPSWEHHIPTILPGLTPEKALRRYYTFVEPTVAWRAKVPAACEIRRLDQALVSRADLQYMTHVAGWIHSFWHTEAEFLDTGLGFCLLQDDTVASWCLSVFVSGSEVEVGLATVPDYRRQGYATLVAAACVDHCASQGLTPHWHCWEDNVPSQRVAEKVGFASPRSYTVYRFEI